MQEALQIIVSVESLQCQARALQAWQDFMALQARQAAQSDRAIEHRRFSKMATVFNTWSMCAALLPFLCSTACVVAASCAATGGCFVCSL